MKQLQQGKTPANRDSLDVTVRLDAVKVAADEFRKHAFGKLAGYHVDYDYRLRGGSEERMYERVCQYVNAETGTKIAVAYNPAHSWMPPSIVTLNPNDETGLLRPTLEEVLAILPGHRFLKLELSHDFDAGSVVNARFARKHLVIGKSHKREDPAHPNMIYFGSRRSPVFARCYWKKSIDSYRIEIEFHREWLKKHRIRTTTDFLRLPDLICRRHIAFYKIDALKLSACLARLDLPVESTLRRVIARADNLHAVLRYLRHKLGIVNALRLLTPLAINTRVLYAQRLWARGWRRQTLGEVA